MNNIELSSMNNVVNIVFGHDNNVVTTLFSHYCCNNLLTSCETGMSTTGNMVVLSIQSGNQPVKEGIQSR